jgi:hypothetical protein
VVVVLAVVTEVMEVPPLENRNSNGIRTYLWVTYWFAAFWQ